MNDGYYWCKAGEGKVPPEAIKAGVDKDGGYLYIGKALHGGDILPAKVAPKLGCAYVAWDGEEHKKKEYEVLNRRGSSCKVAWVEANNGEVPPGAFPIGKTSKNETLYVGRVFHDGALIPGKIHPSLKTCYISYGGEEIKFPSYEVLVLQAVAAPSCSCSCTH